MSYSNPSVFGMRTGAARRLVLTERGDPNEVWVREEIPEARQREGWNPPGDADRNSRHRKVLGIPV